MRRRLGQIFFVVVAGLIWIALRGWNPAILDQLRETGAGAIIDRVAPSAPGAAPVTIVEITDKTISELGGWPIRRDIFAELLRRIAAERPAAIGVTVILADYSNSALGTVQGRDALAGAIESGRTVLGLAPAQQTADPGFPVLKSSVLVGNRDLLTGLPAVSGLIASAARYMEGARGAGLVALQASHGGVPRRLPLMVNHAGTPAPSLPLDMIRLASGADEIAIDGTGGTVSRIRVGARKIATGAEGVIWFSASDSSAIPRIAAHEILTGGADLSSLSGRYVLLGVTASGLAQIFSTGGDGALPGLDALALSLAALVAGQHFHYPPHMLIFEFAAMLLIASLLSWSVFTLSVRRLCAAALGGCLATIIAAVCFGHFRREIFDYSLPVILVLITAVICILYIHRARSRREAGAIAERDRLISELRAMSARNALSGENLSATLAHELRQPLTTMRNYLTAISRSLSGRQQGVGDDVSQYAERARDQASRMDEIMQSVSEAVRLESTRRITTDFPEIVVHAARETLSGSPRPEAGIVTDIPGGLPPALVNANQIELLIKNLVGNAAEAAQQRDMKAGTETGLTLRISMRAAPGNMIETSISDDAGGFPDSIAGALFDPFVSDKPGGSGIGLALCRDIAEAHGGSILVRSLDDPEGTEFRFTVPAADAKDDA